MLDVDGRWPGILNRLGLSDKQLSGKHAPCPTCGGKDRFRFDDKEGRGTWFCSNCGAGDGWGLAKRLTGLDFDGARNEVAKLIDGSIRVTHKPALTDEQKRIKLRKLWHDSSIPAPGGQVLTYLKNRVGINQVCSHIREHPLLPYDKTTSYPAMIARVIRDGRCVTIHRTYILDGKKAPVEAPKKLMPGLGVIGGSIQLGDPAPTMGVAEGIETALAASVMFGMPVWAAISAAGVEGWQPPPQAKRVVVFADNDANGVGQCASYQLMRRLYGNGVDVEVMVPAMVGTDWADEWQASRQHSEP